MSFNNGSNPISDVFGFLPNYEDYCTSLTFNCNDPIPPCSSPKRLDFGSLWQITENYFKLCKADGAWFSPATVSLATLALSATAAYQIAGRKYTPFPKADVWSRLTTWKFPLIQLIATFPRSPIGILVEVLTVLHLVSDPIGTMEDLLWKLESCKRRAEFWRDKIRASGIVFGSLDTDEDQEERDKWERRLAIITDSYYELGDDIGQRAQAILAKRFDDVSKGSRERLAFLNECSITAGALAADRATTFGPVLVAEFVFIAVFLINIIRLQSGENKRLTSTTRGNIEMHSIGFSALFFWLIPSVYTAALIGTSQTEKAIPRILTRFKRDLRRWKIKVDLPDVSGVSTKCSKRRWYNPKRWLNPSRWLTSERWLHGMYSWQPLQRKPTKHAIFPFFIVGDAILTGILITYFVPPRGWMCRTWGESYFFFGWLGSYFLSTFISWIPKRDWFPHGARFSIMLLKDLAVTSLIIAWILITQIGCYNKPECYMHGDTSGLVLPEQEAAYDKLQRGLRFGGSYVTILSLGIVFQVVLVLGWIYWRYASSIWTLTQRDNNANEASDEDSDSNDRDTRSKAVTKSSTQESNPSHQTAQPSTATGNNKAPQVALTALPSNNMEMERLLRVNSGSNMC